MIGILRWRILNVRIFISFLMNWSDFPEKTLAVSLLPYPGRWLGKSWCHRAWSLFLISTCSLSPHVVCTILICYLTHSDFITGSYWPQSFWTLLVVPLPSPNWPIKSRNNVCISKTYSFISSIISDKDIKLMNLKDGLRIYSWINLCVINLFFIGRNLAFDYFSIQVNLKITADFLKSF